jgi:hypothetical protein
VCQNLEDAEKLAQIHYQSTSTSKVFVVSASVGPGDQADEPIKLLEVNEDTIPTGIVPLRFGPLPERGITRCSTIIEVTPDEYQQIENGKLPLPPGWEQRQLVERQPQTEHSGQ